MFVEVTEVEVAGLDGWDSSAVSEGLDGWSESEGELGAVDGHLGVTVGSEDSVMSMEVSSAELGGKLVQPDLEAVIHVLEGEVVSWLGDSEIVILDVHALIGWENEIRDGDGVDSLLDHWPVGGLSLLEDAGVD